jgi:hypothetical protein
MTAPEEQLDAPIDAFKLGERRRSARFRRSPPTLGLPADTPCAQ